MSKEQELKSEHISHRLTATNVLAIVLVSIIYFTIYYHSWFMKLFGWQRAGNQNVIFIFSLFYLFIIYQLVLLKRDKVLKYKVNINKRRLFVPVLLYFVFSFLVIIMHEEGFDAIKRYLIYLFTPMMVFLSVFGMYRSNEKIKMTLRILFILGVIFAAYSTILHAMARSGIDIVSMYGETISNYGEDLRRFTLPGIGPNVLPSMWVPLILTGFYFSRDSYGKLRYLYIGAALFLLYNIFLTATRGAFVSLVLGMTYLIWRGWFRFNKKTILIILCFVLVVYSEGDFLLSRFSKMFVMNYSIYQEGVGLDEMEELGGELRFLLIVDTLSHIKSNPVFGSGFTYFASSQGQKGGSHNVYIDILANAGLVVLMPLMFVLFLLYVNSNKILHKRLYVDTSSRDLGIVLVAGLLSWIVDRMFAAGLSQIDWIWYGFVAAWTRNCEVESRHEEAKKVLSTLRPT